MNTKLILIPSIVLAVAAAATPKDDASRRAEDIWARSRAMYAALQSYADSGTVDVEYGSAIDPSHDHHTFTTYFRKPRYYYFDFYKNGNDDRLVVWSDMDAFHGWWKTTGLETTYPKGSGSTVFVSSVYPTTGSIVMISPLVFPGAGLVGTLTEFGDATDEGTEKVNGHACHKLVGVAKSTYRSGYVTNVRKTTVWIDAESFLVRRVREEARASVATHVSRTTTTFLPHANPMLGDSLFRFVAPPTQ
jgi:outer membrane lipoprotein-sorting protein